MLAAVVRAGVLTVAAVLMTAVAYAQNGAIRGTVTVKENDAAQPVPRKDVQIVILRQDIKGRYVTKTDKNGFFFYSLPAFSEYVVAAFGPGLKRKVLQPIRVQGGDPVEVKLELVPGDGAVPTDEQINAEARATAPTTTPTGQPREMTAEEKAEEEKRKAERERITKENEKITESNASMQKHIEAGNAAFNKKDYQTAAAEYRAGIAIDPNQMVFHGNLSTALQKIAVEKYNGGVKAKDANLKQEARAAFQEAAASALKANELEAAQPAEKQTGEYRLKAAEPLAFLGQLFGDTESAAKAGQLYLQISESPQGAKEKAKFQFKAAEAFRNGNLFDKAEPLYRSLLAADPNNFDAMNGLGLTIISLDPELKDVPRAQEAYTLFETVGEKSNNADQKQQAAISAQYIKDTLKDLVRPGKKKKG
jgi:tetratricopeptide (TPR) repeat protein